VDFFLDEIYYLFIELDYKSYKYPYKKTFHFTLSKQNYQKIILIIFFYINWRTYLPRPSIQASNPIYIRNQRAHHHHQLQPQHQLHIERFCDDRQEEQEEGNAAQILVEEEVEANKAVANILLDGRCNADALTETVIQAWNALPADTIQ